MAAVRSAVETGATSEVPSRHRIWQIAADAGLLALAWYLAFQLRFDQGVPPRYHEFLSLEVFVVVVAAQLAIFVVFGVYDHWWRYVSIRDMWRALLAVTVGSIVAVARRLPLAAGRGAERSRGASSPSTGSSLLALVIGARVLARTHHRAPRPAPLRRPRQGRADRRRGRRGSAGHPRDAEDPGLGYSPTGLVDDDPRKKNMRLNGVRVIGSTDQLPHLLEDNRPDEVIIAIPSAAGETRQKIVNACRDAGVPVKTLPASTS